MSTRKPRFARMPPSFPGMPMSVRALWWPTTTTTMAMTAISMTLYAKSSALHPGSQLLPTLIWPLGPSTSTPIADTSLLSPLSHLPPPTSSPPSSPVGGESIWDPGVFTIIIIFFPQWWLSYNKLFYLSRWCDLGDQETGHTGMTLTDEGEWKRMWYICMVASNSWLPCSTLSWTASLIPRSKFKLEWSLKWKDCHYIQCTSAHLMHDWTWHRRVVWF